jgi:hypothetical protein
MAEIADRAMIRIGAAQSSCENCSTRARAGITRRNGDAAWLLWSFDWRDASPGRGEIQPAREELRDRLVGNREDNAQWPRSPAIESDDAQQND